MEENVTETGLGGDNISGRISDKKPRRGGPEPVVEERTYVTFCIEFGFYD